MDVHFKFLPVEKSAFGKKEDKYFSDFVLIEFELVKIVTKGWTCLSVEGGWTVEFEELGDLISFRSSIW